MKVLRWVGDYWLIPLFMVGASILAIFVSRRGHFVRDLEKILITELAAIDAKREARDIRLGLGMEQAKQHVLDKYAQRRKSLDAKAEERVRRLENSPEHFAQALERLTR